MYRPDPEEEDELAVTDELPSFANSLGGVDPGSESRNSSNSGSDGGGVGVQWCR